MAIEVLDLFCGMGGLSLGFRSGYQVRGVDSNTKGLLNGPSGVRYGFPATVRM